MNNQEMKTIYLHTSTVPADRFKEPMTNTKFIFTNDYSKLDDEELDRLAGERFIGHRYENEFGNGYYWDGVKPFHVKHDLSETLPKNHLVWNPTHPDSNQAERYLFSKLKLSFDNIECVTVFQKEGSYTEISKRGEKILSGIQNTDDDQINRTKVIACLQAMDKLNELRKGDTHHE